MDSNINERGLSKNRPSAVLKKDNQDKVKTSSFADYINKELIEKSKLHTIVSQEFIVITSDKLMSLFHEFQAGSKLKKSWITPLCLIVTLISTLAAAEFKKFIGIGPEIWKASFIFMLVFCCIWFCRDIHYAIKHRHCNIESIFKKIKEESKKEN